MKQKLALGTVQFGLDYSISNQAGQVPVAAVQAILHTAKAHGITTLDTAQAYGNAEQVLGEQPLIGDFALISKVSPGNSTPEHLQTAVQQSLKALKRPQLDGLLLHNADSLIHQGDALFAALTAVKQAGLVKKIGVSVYHPEQLVAICQRFAIDVVQLPGNLFDQRFMSQTMVDLYREHQLEVHCRSAFLQGIIFCPVEQLASFFDPLKPALKLLREQADTWHSSPVSICLAFLQQYDWINKIVVGCCSQDQLLETLTAYQQVTRLLDHRQPTIDFSMFAVHNDKVTNPVNWPPRM